MESLEPPSDLPPTHTTKPPSCLPPAPDVEICKAEPSDVRFMAGLVRGKCGGRQKAGPAHVYRKGSLAQHPSIPSRATLTTRTKPAMDPDTEIPVGWISVGIVPDGIQGGQLHGQRNRRACELGVAGGGSQRAEARSHGI
ncbi:MAG: hypothetical protein ALECFALPRED_007147 [Alectoria fallacina]|uniref:Uncharacterized protein n=1 Tax=Alectoria fallacina TaxID=1903189 RepID=A0A8H3G632_9LECA|nr:MAG: hypothetical protein ALECFALPRED_007147 [Alectoria fallacina]